MELINRITQEIRESIEYRRILGEERKPYRYVECKGNPYDPNKVLSLDKYRRETSHEN